MNAKRDSIDISGITNYLISDKVMCMLVALKRDGYELGDIIKYMNEESISKLCSALIQKEDLDVYLRPLEIYRENMIDQLNSYIDNFEIINSKKELKEEQSQTMNFYSIKSKLKVSKK